MLTFESQRIKLESLRVTWISIFKGDLLFILSFIHSFIQAIAPLQVHTSHKRSRHVTDTLPELHAEEPQTTASEGLAQGPYMAARYGFQPATFRTKGAESTNAPPRPRMLSIKSSIVP